MTKKSFLAAIAASLIAAASGAMAKGGGHGEMGPKGHSLDRGSSNTNRQFSTTSERGLDHALERMDEEGLEHSDAFERHEELEVRGKRDKTRGREKSPNRKSL